MPIKSTESLFSPYVLGDLKLKNRIVMAPLTRTRAENRGKVPNELMAEYYTQRAHKSALPAERSVRQGSHGIAPLPSLRSLRRLCRFLSSRDHICPDRCHILCGK